MRFPLSPRYSLVEDGDVIYLIDRRTERKIWPGDIFEPYPTWGFRPAAEHVAKMARSAQLKPEHRRIADRFRIPPALPSGPDSERASRERPIDPFEG